MSSGSRNATWMRTHLSALPLVGAFVSGNASSSTGFAFLRMRCLVWLRPHVSPDRGFETCADISGDFANVGPLGAHLQQLHGAPTASELRRFVVEIDAERADYLACSRHHSASRG